ncbi:hypothetical protein [Thermococcus gammatolerans]|uniref:Archaeal flagellar protein F (FlaF) n=1 Tax=Thermococcus gammatolerans (strain DSM 15229 / JCM 11827 / EJ3) TaxID=593117 RepID=C5A729_THEGJ|nr:hypothetical protein [Thermococcus gammatolerans]ACS34041.1 Archaeal flagellar protein F (flaF) [Thermococcus gammatolerans EJ3]
MGFSVSASAAIIFISFLIAAATLYTAWDNSYNNVQAAQEDWYNRRISQLNTLVSLNASLGSATIDNANGYYNVTFHIQNSGVTQYLPYWSVVYDGEYRTIYNVSDDNIGFISDYTYLFPSQVAYLNVTRIPLNTEEHSLVITFGNGCWLRLIWHYNGTDVLLDATPQRGCPTEVS